jgi:hypothetical protein
LKIWRNLTLKEEAKLVEFTLGNKNSKIFPIYLSQNSEISPEEKTLDHHPGSSGGEPHTTDFNFTGDSFVQNH